MNRRSFLTRVSTGIVGAAVATKVPLAWLPAPVRRYAALEYLRNSYNDACHHVQLSRAAEPHSPHDYPAAMVVQRWLYEQVEGELIANKRIRGEPEILYIERDVPVPHVMFKAIPVTYDDAFVTLPREVRVLDPDQWARYLGARRGINKALSQFWE